MLILFFAANVPDRGGAFYSDLCLAREFRRRGHSVVLIQTRNTLFGNGVYEGFPWKTQFSAGRELDASHIWVAPHQPHAHTVRKLNATYRRPLIFTLHFEGNPDMFNFRGTITWPEMFWSVNSRIPKSLVPNGYPAQVVRHSVRTPFIEKGLVLLDATPTEGCITLINANVNKGLAFFLKLAAAMPNHKFLGVRSYYHPPTDLGIYVPPNITWINFTRDMKSILSQTRILVMPSRQESFGVVAAEALINGIPVMQNKPDPQDTAQQGGSTWGVREWIDPAGIACERDNVEEWATTIRALDDPETYAARSELSRSHAEPYFDTAPQGADEIIAFASSAPPVHINQLTTVRNDPAPQAPGRQLPSVIPKRPNQPVSWQNGRLTFGRR